MFFERVLLYFKRYYRFSNNMFSCLSLIIIFIHFLFITYDANKQKQGYPDEKITIIYFVLVPAAIASVLAGVVPVWRVR